MITSGEDQKTAWFTKYILYFLSKLLKLENQMYKVINYLCISNLYLNKCVC